MNKYMLMTALALVLAAPAAHAEYTGNGAISSSSSSVPSGTTPNHATTAATDAKERLKDSWEKLKTDHAQTWDKLEAARRSHWHVPSLHRDAPATGEETASSGGAGGEAGSQDASGPAPAQGGYDGARPSRWEKFKDDHQDQKAAIEGHVEAAKDKAHTSIQQFKDEHKDTIANAKEKLGQWKEDHQDGINALKDKLHLHHKDQ